MAGHDEGYILFSNVFLQIKREEGKGTCNNLIQERILLSL